MASNVTQYPAGFAVDYPESLDRLTTLFRPLVAIPILVVLGAVGASFGDSSGEGWALVGGGVLFLPVLLLILFRQKYPRWWFDWNLALSRFAARVVAYFALLRDEYPSTDEEQAVHLELEYPDAGRDLNRWLPLVKWLLAIPHVILLFFLGVGVVFAVIIAWFAILFTGRYPLALFNYVVGVMRWSVRVQAYAIFLTTDRYPPFSLS